MKKILLLFLPLLILVACKKDDGEFTRYIQTDETGLVLGTSNGEDLPDQWSPRSDAPITSKPAYPNPFKGSCTLVFQLQNEGNVKVQLLDKPGHVVETITDQTFDAGYYNLIFDPADLETSLEPGKIYQIKIISSGIEIYGNIKYEGRN